MEEEFVSLEMIKTHLNIEQDFKSLDSYLLHLRSVAFLVVQNHICDDIDGMSEEQKKPLAHAILLLLSTWYMNRESLSNLQKGNHSYEYILSLYKNYNG